MWTIINFNLKFSVVVNWEQQLIVGNYWINTAINRLQYSIPLQGQLRIHSFSRDLSTVFLGDIHDHILWLLNPERCVSRSILIHVLWLREPFRIVGYLHEISIKKPPICWMICPTFWVQFISGLVFDGYWALPKWNPSTLSIRILHKNSGISADGWLSILTSFMCSIVTIFNGFASKSAIKWL